MAAFILHATLPAATLLGTQGIDGDIGSYLWVNVSYHSWDTFSFSSQVSLVFPSTYDSFVRAASGVISEPGITPASTKT